jgi:HEAT repeat protein
MTSSPKNRAPQHVCLGMGAFFAVVAFLFTLIVSKGPPSDDSAGELSIGELFRFYGSKQGLERLDSLVAFAERGEEAAAWLEHLLRFGNDAERYEAARIAGELGGEDLRAPLLAVAVDPKRNGAVRAAACYALRESGLNEAEKAVLLKNVAETGCALADRAALAALAGQTDSDDVPVLESLLLGDDPLTRLYAARLLTEQGCAPALSFFKTFSESEDYLVRQEAYDALGASDVHGADVLLRTALAREANSSAARMARLALGFYRARQISPDAERSYFETILDSGEDEERLWALNTLNTIDKVRAYAAVGKLARENSDMGVWCRARFRVRADVKEKVMPGRGRLPIEKHHSVVHHTLTEESLQRYHAQPWAPRMDLADDLRLVSAVVLEDSGVKPLRHAYNPLTGRGFFGYGTFGGAARRYMGELLDELKAATDVQNTETSLDLAGRVLHLVEDMSSPLHIFGVSHPFNTCLFEAYWRDNHGEVETVLHGREIIPAHPAVVPAECREILDPFSVARLQKRLEAIPDTMPGRLEALSWATYFTASHWGEIRFDDTTAEAHTLPGTFREKHVEAQDNGLYAMFNGRIRYHTSWWGDYFEIEDRMGNTFSWNKCFLVDGFRPCSNPVGGPSCEGVLRSLAEVEGKEVLRITGRFYFTQRGFRVPHCHPVQLPNGTPTDMHLSRYYGETLFPLTVAHGIGWFNLLVDQCPFLFADAGSVDNATRMGETDLTDAKKTPAEERDSDVAGPDARATGGTPRPRQAQETLGPVQETFLCRFLSHINVEDCLKTIAKVLTGSCRPAEENAIGRKK